MRPLVCCFLLALIGRAGVARAADNSGPCENNGLVRIWWSPRIAVASAPLRLMAISDQKEAIDVQIRMRGGRPLPLTAIVRGGPPFSATIAVAKPLVGVYEVNVVAKGRTLACARITVMARAIPVAAPAGPGKPVWVSRQPWNAATEGLYAAWIEQLFDGPVDKPVEFRPLHQALRDPDRNFLANYLGLREDDPKYAGALSAAPDCADLPYFLRAYFAWKLELPFAYRDCDRGTEARPPRCGAIATNDAPAESRDPLIAMKRFMRAVLNRVQSGSARTALADEQTDYYPVALDRAALRPGVIYADPYGHVLMIVKWLPQTADKGGLLLAVDGQPDTSIGRKRFWEGTFLFASDTPAAGPGFKAFRPVVAAPGQPGTSAQPLDNAALKARAASKQDTGFAPYANQQATLSADAFYARMAGLINPAGLNALQAYSETMDALVEQLQTRVGSVDNGETFMRGAANALVPMPEGAKIFETTGPWEDYATPSRDMRLLIAMNVLLDLPARIVRHPELYNLGGQTPETVRAGIAQVHQERIGTRGIEYRRSDGSPWKLTVADLLARRTALEVAYNPNDCVEVRWGAKEGTEEYATCTRHLPSAQRAAMESHRAWFREARRPPR